MSRLHVFIRQVKHPMEGFDCFLMSFQEGSDDEDEGEEEEEENTDYLTDSNKENETDEENAVCMTAFVFSKLCGGFEYLNFSP